MKRNLSLLLSVLIIVTSISFLTFNIDAASITAPKVKCINYVGGKFIKLKCSNKKSKIYYKLSSNGKYKLYKSKINLTSNVTIYYYSKNAKIKSKIKKYKVNSIDKLVVSQPTYAIHTSQTSIKVTIPYVAGATGYYVYRSKDNENFEYVSNVDCTTYVDNNIEANNIKYYYKFQAYGLGKITSDISQSTYSIYTFRNDEYLNEHFNKHGLPEMGYSSSLDYLLAANEVIYSEASKTKKEKEDNDDLFYNTAHNDFVVLSSDGYIRTYFYCSGESYFNRQ